MQQANPLAIRGTDHVVSQVRDMRRMVVFHCDLLGCQRERGPGEAGFAQLRAGDSLVDLADTIDRFGRGNGDPPDPSRRSVDHLCLAIELRDEVRIRAHLAEWGNDGLTVASRCGARGDGSSIYQEDSEGNTVELKGISPGAPSPPRRDSA